MSPARSRRRQPLPHRRNRADIVKAVGVAAAIVLLTALLIWLLRPGPAGIPGTGGVMNRQPRASWLIVGALVAGGLVAWFVLRRGSRARRRAILSISFVVLIVVTVVIGFVWPGGLLRHDVAPSAVPEPTTTPTSTPTTPTTQRPSGPSGATGAGGASGASGATGGTGATGAPASRGASGATGGSGPAATTPAPGPANPSR